MGIEEVEWTMGAVPGAYCLEIFQNRHWENQSIFSFWKIDCAPHTHAPLSTGSATTEDDSCLDIHLHFLSFLHLPTLSRRVLRMSSSVTA